LVRPTGRKENRAHGCNIENLDQELVAQRGQMLLIFSHDLTPSENTVLDPVLTNHNSTLLSAEQTLEDQDVADLDALIASDRAAFREESEGMLNPGGQIKVMSVLFAP
jgi:hypothetical protein